MRATSTAAFLVAGFLLLGTLGGCSDGTEIRSSLSPEAFRREVLALDQGMSLEQVRSELGEPLSEFTENPTESALRYQGWLLLFNEQGLEQRIRQYWPPGRRRHLIGRTLDSAVLQLGPGMSLASVKAELGVPQSYEEVFRSILRPELILRYGPWELAFNNGRLRQRTQQ